MSAKKISSQGPQQGLVFVAAFQPPHDVRGHARGCGAQVAPHLPADQQQQQAAAQDQPAAAGLSSLMAKKASPQSRITARPRPSKIAIRRLGWGSPAAAMPTATALSLARVTSISTIWMKATQKPPPGRLVKELSR